jgi:hypothetical protein
MKYNLAALGFFMAISLAVFAESEGVTDPAAPVEGFPMDPPTGMLNSPFGADHGLPVPDLKPHEDEAAPQNPVIEVSKPDRPGYYAVFDRSINKDMIKVVSMGSGSGGKDGGGPAGEKEKKKKGHDDQSIDAIPPSDDLHSYLHQLQDRHSDLFR